MQLHSQLKKDREEEAKKNNRFAAIKTKPERGRACAQAPFFQNEKMYESVGVVPWKNLIVTYDDEDGNINVGIIESEIKNK